MFGEKNRYHLQDKLAREWNRRNRDPFLYWAGWISGGMAIVCLVAVVIRQVWFR